MLQDLAFILKKRRWMREQRIWPNGLRYLWMDAFGLVLLVSLYRKLGDNQYIDEAEWLVAEVQRVLGRRRGIRIGETADRDGQYFHYLAMWLYALSRLGELLPDYRAKGIALARLHGPAGSGAVSSDAGRVPRKRDARRYAVAEQGKNSSSAAEGGNSQITESDLPIVRSASRGAQPKAI